MFDYRGAFATTLQTTTDAPPRNAVLIRVQVSPYLWTERGYGWQQPRGKFKFMLYNNNTPHVAKITPPHRQANRRGFRRRASRGNILRRDKQWPLSTAYILLLLSNDCTVFVCWCRHTTDRTNVRHRKRQTIFLRSFHVQNFRNPFVQSIIPLYLIVQHHDNISLFSWSRKATGTAWLLHGKAGQIDITPSPNCCRCMHTHHR